MADTARPKVQSSPVLWSCQLFSTVNEYNRWAGPASSTNIYKYQPTNQQTVPVCPSVHEIQTLLTSSNKEYKISNIHWLSLFCICLLTLILLFGLQKLHFQSNPFFLSFCFVESSHRLKYSINPLIVRLQYFLALCKFYSSDHQIMQSSILKYFKLGQDKKLL